MKRKDFLNKSIFGAGSIIALPVALSSCAEEDTVNPDGDGSCSVSPRETAGPFPIKTPADLARANIIADRAGIALLMNIQIQNSNNDCEPLAGVLVDVWHCDAQGNYSEYGDFEDQSFLRGRQTTDANGRVSFISIYPGWYPGRAPHIHIEILEEGGNSLLISQIAFPEDISEAVYSADGYNGTADTSNSGDGIFRDSLSENMTDAMEGNNVDGYTLEKVIVVSA